MRRERYGSRLSGSTDTEDEKGGGLLGYTGDGGLMGGGLGVGDGMPMVGRIWIGCSRLPIAFGLLEVLTKQILDLTASKIWGSGQM